MILDNPNNAIIESIDITKVYPGIENENPVVGGVDVGGDVVGGSEVDVSIVK